MLALALVGAALTIALGLPSTTAAVPMCAYQLTWYSTAAKTTAVGFRYVAPESCGCYVSDVGQHTPYYTVVTNLSCWLSE
jgi:hypothetical protein